MLSKRSLTSVLPFISVNLMSNLVLTFQGIVILKLISPAVMGIWIGLQLIQNYGIQCHFGILNGMSRQIPFYLGQNALDIASRVESVSRYSIFLLSGFGLTCVSLLFASKILSDELNSAVCAMILITIVRLNMEFHIGLFKARQQFNKATWVVIAEATFMFITLPLVHYFQLEGLILRSLITALILLVFCAKLNSWNMHVEKDTVLTREIIGKGFPIMILGFALVVLGSMDRMLIIRFLDTESLGLYSIGLAVASILSLIPAFSGQAFYPKMIEVFSVQGISKEMLALCGFASLVSVSLAVLASLTAYLFVPFFVHQYLNNYVAGIPAMNIMLTSGIFLSLTAGPNYFIITVEQKARQIALIALVVLVMILFGTKFSNQGLEGILWVVVFGSFLYAVGLWSLVLAAYKKKGAS